MAAIGMILFCSMAFLGCNQNESTGPNLKPISFVRTSPKRTHFVFKAEAEGHEYLLLDTTIPTMIHSESCPCKKGTK